MLIFLENLLITLFCSLFAFSKLYDISVIIYLIIFFSLSLWLSIINNLQLKFFFLILFIISFFVISKTIIFFSPLFISSNLNYLQNKKNFEVFFNLVYKLTAILCIFFNFNLLFFNFALIIFFYSIVKKKYLSQISELIKLKDILSENKIQAEKNIRMLQNYALKNAEVLILSERNRISGSLHNSIGHTLSSSILQVNALKYISNQQNVKEGLNVLQTSLENGMTEIRECLHNMHNHSFNLQTAIEQISENTPQIKIDLNYKIHSLNYELKYDILSIIKESISNTIKHSTATEMYITILEHISFYLITIKDNGCGIGKKSIEDISSGIGLTVLKDITSKHGGTINFYFDDGFKIHIIFPKV